MERVSFDLKIWILSQKRRIKLRKTYVYILVSSSNFNPESWWDFLSQAFIHWCFSPGELSLTWKSTLFNNEIFWNDQESKFLNHWKSLLYLDRLLWLQSLEITSLPWSVVMTSTTGNYFFTLISCYDFIQNSLFEPAINGKSEMMQPFYVTP